MSPGNLWDELDREDATGLAELVRRGKISPAELLERSIKRMDKLNPVINAVTLRHDELARESLTMLDRETPFAGVPFLLKDLAVAMAGTRITNGSRFFAGMQLDHDGELVRRFRAAGLVIVGKAASPELGLTTTTESAANGLVRNPWNLGLTAGGSSGGSAAAVAAGLVPIAHASDGGGSIRIPAAACGLFGLKPSRGRVPFPIRRYQGWAGLSTHFAVTRSVRDAARLLDAVAGPEAGAAFMAAPRGGEFLAATRQRQRPLRIARLPAPLSGTPVDPQCERAVDLAVEACRKLGHKVEVATPAIDFKAYNAAFGTVVAVNTRATLNDREKQLGRACTPQDVEPVTWFIAEAGRQIDALTYAAACETFDQTARQSAAFFADWDLLLSPTLAKPPVPLGVLSLSPKDFQQYSTEVSLFSPYASLANVTGQPAMSLPLAESSVGMPIGVMFLGRYAEESTLLGLASALERELPWRERRPRFGAA
ncbi:MAG: amidase [Gammaproteobacteria bacterium]